MKKCRITINGQVYTNSELADTFFSRFRGFMLRKKKDGSHLLIISRCSSIHTMFMFFPIDVFYLDRELNVLSVVRNISPFRFSKGPKKAYYTLEAVAGNIPDTEEYRIHLERI